MARLAFLLAHSTEAPDRAVTVLAMALATQRAGHEVVLWLTGEGVRLGVVHVAETLREPGPLGAAEMVAALVAGGAPLLCERRSFEVREFEADALRPGAAVAEPERLAALLADGFQAVTP